MMPEEDDYDARRRLLCCQKKIIMMPEEDDYDARRRLL